MDQPRREFLKTVGALSLSSPLLLGTEEKKKIPVAGKDERLIVLTDFPAVLETPTELLWKHDITPLDLLFVRNNQQPENSATIRPASLDNWTIAIDGLVNKSMKISASELAKMDQTEYEMVLQCSGNSRALYAQTVKSKGTQWGRGGMGNVKFSGVPLSKLLAAKSIEPKPKARFVTVDGRDTPLPMKEDFQHSLPLDDVLNRSILALKLNGKPIPAIHGGPVRLITPGIYGTMQLKWVSRLRFDPSETTNHNHIPRYRVPVQPIQPGEKIEYTFENSRFNWDMKVKSVVLTPTDGAKLRAGKTLVGGVAFNDGQAQIDSVIYSLNKGRTWQRAKLERPKSSYAWTKFSFEIDLKKGRHSIWTRAVDALGRSQPLDGSIHWNPSGYEWNGVEKINVTV